jgi:hypothetical protein
MPRLIEMSESAIEFTLRSCLKKSDARRFEEQQPTKQFLKWLLRSCWVRIGELQ